MTDRSTILCYDDNPVYGGHQIMACLAVEALAKSPSWKPVFFCSAENARLIKRLKEIQNSGGCLEIVPTPFTTRKLQGLRNRLAVPSIRKLRKLFEKENPDIILCIQGDIEDGSLALCAAEKMQAPCISYIPVPHRMSLMGARFGTLRDQINATLFKKPDGWITISESMQDLLRERGATAPIEVVHNGIDTVRFSPLEKTAARAALGLPPEKTILGTIGRIEFNQKRQDFLVRCFYDAWKQDDTMHLAITGDGPDRKRLEELVDQLELRTRVSMLPWQENSALVYSALDLLIIPSRFEGVPLVMLEALACGTPVIGSARDGMKDLLPPDRTFETENSAALIRTAEQALKDRGTSTERLQSDIQQNFTVEKFQQNFETALTRFIARTR